MTKKRTLNEYRQTKEYKSPVPEIDKSPAEAFLDECDYISQDGDTVSIDEGLIHETMEAYANQRVIEELERLSKVYQEYNESKDIDKRIKELKQD